MAQKLEYENLYEVRYIDINSMSHEDKVITVFGYDEEDVKENLMSFNLKDEKENVINEPNIVIKSIKRLGEKINT